MQNPGRKTVVDYLGLNPKVLIPLKAACRSLMDFPLRSSLTLLGIVLGAAAIIALANIVHSSKQTMLKDFDALGLRQTVVSFDIDNYSDFESILQKKKSLKDKFAGATSLSLMRTGYAQMYHRAAAENVTVIATTANLQQMLNLGLKSGRFLSEFNRDQNFAVIGHRVVERYQERSIIIRIGDLISVGNTPVKIVGILNSVIENGISSFDIDDAVILPVDRHKYFGRNLSSGTVMILRENDVDHSTIEQTIIDELQAIKPDLDYYALSPESFIQSTDQQMETVSLLGNAISVISLLTGGIGVLNIMLVAVSERRREIGLRRAVGATRKNIQNQFLIEAFILCFVGGVIGSVLGLIAAVAFSAFTDISFVLLPSSIALGLGICSIVGITFGYYPAVIATRVEPVAALYGA